MTLPGSGPWQLAHGHVETLDDSLGYVFARRRESAASYRERAGWAPGGEAAAGQAAAAGPGRGYLIVAGFAVHDVRYGAEAKVEVRREQAPTREEAEALIWPAVWEVTAEALGEGDWGPSLSWLDVVELSDRLPEA